MVHAFQAPLRLIAVLSFSGGRVRRESALQCGAPRQGTSLPKHAVAPPSPNSDMALRQNSDNSDGPEDQCGWRAEGRGRSPGGEGRCRPADVEGSPHACATPEPPRAAQKKGNINAGANDAGHCAHERMRACAHTHHIYLFVHAPSTLYYGSLTHLHGRQVVRRKCRRE